MEVVLKYELVGTIKAHFRNIKLTVEYEGTDYHGWQFQENAATVQEKIEHSLKTIFNQECRVTASGRTDTGVHARGQVINFQSGNPISVPKLVSAMNGLLPRDIVIKNGNVVPEDFHARFSARVRTYQYFIYPGRSAVHRKFSWEYLREIDLDLLNDLAEILLGEHDFAAFSRIQTQTKNKICTVLKSNWRREGEFYIYTVSANRFLHGMVRSIVGTMVETMHGRFSKDEYVQIFNSRDRNRAGTAAPARGLFLESVTYE